MSVRISVTSEDIAASKEDDRAALISRGASEKL
jgi:hypothetical protein